MGLSAAAQLSLAPAVKVQERIQRRKLRTKTQRPPAKSEARQAMPLVIKRQQKDPGKRLISKRNPQVRPRSRGRSTHVLRALGELGRGSACISLSRLGFNQIHPLKKNERKSKPDRRLASRAEGHELRTHRTGPRRTTPTTPPSSSYEKCV